MNDDIKQKIYLVLWILNELIRAQTANMLEYQEQNVQVKTQNGQCEEPANDVHEVKRGAMLYSGEFGRSINQSKEKNTKPVFKSSKNLLGSRPSVLSRRA